MLSGAGLPHLSLTFITLAYRPSQDFRKTIPAVTDALPPSIGTEGCAGVAPTALRNTCEVRTTLEAVSLVDRRLGTSEIGFL